MQIELVISHLNAKEFKCKLDSIENWISNFTFDFSKKKSYYE